MENRNVETAIRRANDDIAAARAHARRGLVGADAPDVDAAERDARTGAWAHVEPTGKFELDPWDVT